MAPLIWFYFMLAVMIGVKVYAEGENKIASKMSHYDKAELKYHRFCRALAVAVVIGLASIPIFVYVFD